MLGEPQRGLGSHLLQDQGRQTQETYLGQLRTMQAQGVFLFCTLLRATGSYGYIQSEEYKTKYLKDLATVEDDNEKQLINDLQQVLERLQSIQFPSLRKKHGYLPVCDPGEQCALRKGSRIGKLCDCSLPRTCNSFLHRCF